MASWPALVSPVAHIALLATVVSFFTFFPVGVGVGVGIGVGVGDGGVVCLALFWGHPKLNLTRTNDKTERNSRQT